MIERGFFCDLLLPTHDDQDSASYGKQLSELLQTRSFHAGTVEATEYSKLNFFDRVVASTTVLQTTNISIEAFAMLTIVESVRFTDRRCKVTVIKLKKKKKTKIENNNLHNFYLYDILQKLHLYF